MSVECALRMNLLTVTSAAPMPIPDVKAATAAKPTPSQTQQDGAQTFNLLKLGDRSDLKLTLGQSSPGLRYNITQPTARVSIENAVICQHFSGQIF